MTVKQLGTATSSQLTLQFNFNSTKFEPVRNLRMFPTNYFNFPKGAHIYFQFISTGVIESCLFTPDLPKGLTSNYNEIKGRILPGVPIDQVTTEYSVQCKNSHSISNKLFFYAAVISGIKANGIKASFWVPSVTGELDCNEKYDPFFNKNLIRSTEAYVNTVQHQYSENVKWNGLGSKFTEYWGVEYYGYITVAVSGDYNFKIKSQHGVWIEINGQEVISAPGCRQYNDTFQSKAISLTENEPYPIRILYFHNRGGSGLEIEFKVGDQVSRPLSIEVLGYGKINIYISGIFSV